MYWRVFTVAIAALLVLALVLFLSRHKPQKWLRKPAPADPEKGMTVYLGFRNLALHPKSSSVNNEPKAAMMEFNINRISATIAAFADGTTSIYSSGGGGAIGGGQTYESIRKAGQNLLATAHEFQPMMHITQDYPLPKPGEVVFYLVTSAGVYTVSTPEAECRSRTSPLTKLYAAGQGVITQYRLNTPPGR